MVTVSRTKMCDITTYIHYTTDSNHYHIWSHFAITNGRVIVHSCDYITTPPQHVRYRIVAIIGTTCETCQSGLKYEVVLQFRC